MSLDMPIFTCPEYELTNEIKDFLTTEEQSIFGTF